jgi:hypothetical protein
MGVNPVNSGIWAQARSPPCPGGHRLAQDLSGADIGLRNELARFDHKVVVPTVVTVWPELFQAPVLGRAQRVLERLLLEPQGELPRIQTALPARRAAASC